MLTRDCWVHVLKYLSIGDINNASTVCKIIYRACNTSTIRKITCGNMKPPFKPNHAQNKVINLIRNSNDSKYHLYGDVGSGKTIVSISAALYLQEKYGECGNLHRIIIIVSPNLVTMWKETIIEKFGIDALVMHNTDKSYKSSKYKSDKDLGNEKIHSVIIISKANYVKFTKNGIFGDNDILIIDEFKQNYNFPCKTALYLSAMKKNCHIWDSVKIHMNANELRKKLLPVVSYEYVLPITLKTYELLCTPSAYIYQDFTTLVSYPFLDKSFPTNEIVIGKKKIKRYFDSDTPFNPKAKADFIEYLKKSPKFLISLEIIKKAIKNDEKVLFFDDNINFLPYLYLAFEQYNIKCKLFTTDYSPSERMKHMKQFKEKKEFNILLSSFRTMIEGYNLSEANHIIFYSPPCKEYRKQCINRCHRYPQSKKVYTYTLYGSILEKQFFVFDYNTYNILFWSHKHQSIKNV